MAARAAAVSEYVGKEVLICGGRNRDSEVNEVSDTRLASSFLEGLEPSNKGKLTLILKESQANAHQALPSFLTNLNLVVMTNTRKLYRTTAFFSTNLT